MFSQVFENTWCLVTKGNERIFNKNIDYSWQHFTYFHKLIYLKCFTIYNFDSILFLTLLPSTMDVLMVPSFLSPTGGEAATSPQTAIRNIFDDTLGKVPKTFLRNPSGITFYLLRTTSQFPVNFYRQRKRIITAANTEKFIRRKFCKS